MSEGRSRPRDGERVAVAHRLRCVEGHRGRARYRGQLYRLRRGRALILSRRAVPAAGDSNSLLPVRVMRDRVGRRLHCDGFVVRVDTRHT